ncbi:MAG: hypothetical protein P8Z71_02080 [Candidatus Sulfobium sp.]
MRRGASRVVLAVLLASLTLSASVSLGSELKTHYVTVVYNDRKYLREFNDNVSLGSLSYLVRNRNPLTAAEETGDKLDVIVERVEAVLDMFPRGLKFTVVLLPSSGDVQKVYRNKYGRSPDYIAFYSPRDNTVFVSLDDVRVGVLAHELTHVILVNYFGISPPDKIQEVLAQFVETHFGN